MPLPQLLAVLASYCEACSGLRSDGVHLSPCPGCLATHYCSPRCRERDRRKHQLMYVPPCPTPIWPWAGALPIWAVYIGDGRIPEVDICTVANQEIRTSQRPFRPAGAALPTCHAYRRKVPHFKPLWCRVAGAGLRRWTALWPDSLPSHADQTPSTDPYQAVSWRWVSHRSKYICVGIISSEECGPSGRTGWRFRGGRERPGTAETANHPFTGTAGKGRPGGGG